MNLWEIGPRADFFINATGPGKLHRALDDGPAQGGAERDVLQRSP